MSESIDKTRRSLIQLGLVTGITLITSRALFADGLTDLIADNTQNQVIAVRLWPSSLYTRLTIESEYAVNAKYSLIDSSQRLVVEIHGVTLNAVLRNLSQKVLVDDPIVANIEAGQVDTNLVRVTIFLKQKTRLQTQNIPPVSLDKVSYKYRYVLDMYAAQTTAPDAVLNDDLLALIQLHNDNHNKLHVEKKQISTESEADNLQNLIAQVGESSFKSVAPNPESVAYTPLKQFVPRHKPAKKLVVMIDPGHGGEDPGAIGPTGTKEKHVVLDIGKHLCDMINATDYMTAKLTRSDDVFIPLGARVAIARRAHADVFMSIHADAFTTPEARGASVFMLSDSGASSSFARWLAKTQNASDLIGGMSFQSHDKMVNRMLLDMTQTWTRHKSDKFGQTLLANLSQIGKLHSKYVEKAAFAVLKAPDIPSVLIETAFISNPDEESLLKIAEFRYRVASAIFNGVGKFVTT